MNNKISIKGDNTNITGVKIIKYFEGLGAKNTYYTTGCGDCYYYVDNANNIDFSYKPINTYKTYESYDEAMLLNYRIDLEPTFPRKMRCWDIDESEGVEDTVFGIFQDRESIHKVIGSNTVWENAKELPQSKQPNPDISITVMDEIKTMKTTINRILEDINKLKTSHEKY